MQCGVQSNLKMLIVTVFCKNVENSWEVIYVSMLCERDMNIVKYFIGKELLLVIRDIHQTFQ